MQSGEEMQTGQGQRNVISGRIPGHIGQTAQDQIAQTWPPASQGRRNPCTAPRRSCLAPPGDLVRGQKTRAETAGQGTASCRCQYPGSAGREDAGSARQGWSNQRAQRRPGQTSGIRKCGGCCHFRTQGCDKDDNTTTRLLVSLCKPGISLKSGWVR